jgi:hypothetical protein
MSLFNKGYLRQVAVGLVFCLLASGCNTSREPTKQKYVLVKYEYVFVNLAPDASLQTTEEGKVEVKSDEQHGKWITVKKADDNASWFSVLSPSSQVTKLRFVGPGTEPCPFWAPDVYTSCSFEELETHGK